MEALLLSGSANDVEAVKRYALDLPEGCIIDADRGCTDYTTEDWLAEAQDVKHQTDAQEKLDAPRAGLGRLPAVPRSQDGSRPPAV